MHKIREVGGEQFCIPRSTTTPISAASFPFSFLPFLMFLLLLWFRLSLSIVPSFRHLSHRRLPFPSSFGCVPSDVCLTGDFFPSSLRAPADSFLTLAAFFQGAWILLLLTKVLGSSTWLFYFVAMWGMRRIKKEMQVRPDCPLPLDTLALLALAGAVHAIYLASIRRPRYSAASLFAIH